MRAVSFKATGGGQSHSGPPHQVTSPSALQVFVGLDLFWIQLDGREHCDATTAPKERAERAEDSLPVDHDYRHTAWGREHPRPLMCVHTHMHAQRVT